MRRTAATLALLIAACGGEAATTTTDGSVDATLAPVATEVVVIPATTTTTAVATAFCGNDATGIEVGVPVEDQVDKDGDFTEELYFCVDLPGGVSTLTVTLTGQEANLDVYVGYPDLDTVQHGGLTFWFSDNNSTDDEALVIEPGLADHLNPGPYYIEVSGAESPFTLLVETS